MFRALLNTKKEPVAVYVTVRVKRPCVVHVLLQDTEIAKCVHTRRYHETKDVVTFEIRMPRPPRVSELIVYDNSGDRSNLKVESIKKGKLDQYFMCLDGNGGQSKEVREFVKFMLEFSEMCGEYNSSTYYSDFANYRIDYLDVIREGNKALSTPARVHTTIGHIEASRSHFIPMTVPQRAAILAHEFSHFNVNEDPDSELQADKNGLKIILGLGFPTIEISNCFTETLNRNPTEENKLRYAILLEQLRNWDHDKYTLCLPAA